MILNEQETEALLKFERWVQRATNGSGVFSCVTSTDQEGALLINNGTMQLSKSEQFYWLRDLKSPTPFIMERSTLPSILIAGLCRALANHFVDNH